MSEIIEFLDNQGIEYWTEGKNVSKGKIAIQCPFCDDTSNHCNISLYNLEVKCWRCGKHTLQKLIAEVADYSRTEANIETKLLQKSLRDSGGGWTGVTPIKKKEASSALTKAVHLPPEASNHFPKMHIEYLEGRGFTRPRSYIKKYKLLSCYTTGRYKFRIIIPIILNGQIVSFTSKDVTDQQEPPYLNASVQESLINPKWTIYNYDTIIKGSDAILVEGVIDVWKLGDGAISILGVEHHEQQIVALMKKTIGTLFILFDNDPPGRKAARSLGRIMAPIVKDVELLFLKDVNDPGALTLSQAELLKRRLGFKV